MTTSINVRANVNTTQHQYCCNIRGIWYSRNSCNRPSFSESDLQEFLSIVNTESLFDYCMVQNFGGVKLWQIDRFRVLVRKMLVNLQ